jgi:tetratricopeptide (TPR) repeat protein
MLKKSIPLKFISTILFIFMIGMVFIQCYADEPDPVKVQVFREINELIEKVQREEAPLLAPLNYSRGMEYYSKALKIYEKEGKIKDIQKNLEQAEDYFTQCIESAKIAQVILEDLLELRIILMEKKLDYYAPKKFSNAERQLNSVINEIEKGDLQSARSKKEKVEKLYRKTVTTGYKDGILKRAQHQLDMRKKKMTSSQFRKSNNSISDIEGWIKVTGKEEFIIKDFIVQADAKIHAIIEILYPEFYRNLPDSLMLGDFILSSVTYEDKGHYDFASNLAVGLSGEAEIFFNCGFHFLIPMFPGTLQVFTQPFLVVETVVNPELELSLVEAMRIDPHIRIGDKLPLPLQVETLDKANILKARADILDLLKPAPTKGCIKVRFEDATIAPTSRLTMGDMISGTAIYPTDFPFPEVPIELYVAGFTVRIDSLVITPSGATADIELVFPKSIVDGDGCGPAIVNLGTISITPDCQFYADRSGMDFGPFIIDKTGMVFQGNGFIADFNKDYSPVGLGLASDWRGVILQSGYTIPELSGTVVSNTGYLSADYSFTNAMVTATGLKSRFNLNNNYAFFSMLPYGYDIGLSSGYVDVDSSSVKGGLFTSGVIKLPTRAVCSGTPGNQIQVTFTNMAVQNDMDLAGAVNLYDKLFWGELSHTGDEMIAFSSKPDVSNPDYAYFYLSGKSSNRFVPDSSTDFDGIALWGDIPKKLEEFNLAGVTVLDIDDFDIYTMDIPGTPPKKISFRQGAGVSLSRSWLNIETLGINGYIHIDLETRQEDLGDPTFTFYKGNVPFDAYLECIGRKQEQCFHVQFASSAVFDSEFHGFMKLDLPCNAKIPFVDLEFTSTANIVGGDIDLSDGPITLEYWGVELVETSPGDPAGALSVKTGQIILTQAGIQEPRHFAKPFKLIWGEMLADGNMGELYFDYNSAGQKFDGFLFTPHHVSLSKYIVSIPGYLQVCGDNHFNFFGSSYLSIQDSIYTGLDPIGVYGGRSIGIMTEADSNCIESDLNLYKSWGSELSTLDFDIVYDSNDQDGFLGEGLVDLPEHFETSVTSSIQIDHSSMAIGLSSSVDNHFMLSGVDMGSSAELWGCITIDENTLSCIMIGFTLESTAQTAYGILGGSGAMIEAKLVIKPTVTTFSAAGLMFVDLSLGGSVSVNGSILLIADRSALSIYGDLQGELDFSSICAGLEADGHVNWYLSPTTQYLQGRAGISVYGKSLGSAGLSGGLFIGNNVPKADVWVLTDGSNKYAVNMSSLPEHITGVYGFGQVGFSMDFGIFSGGIEIYAGLGAFMNFEGLATHMGGLPLPYILANFGVSLHGEILWGLVSASAWVNLQICVGDPFYFQGTAGLKGCILWVLCASADVTIRLDENGFDIY